MSFVQSLKEGGEYSDGPGQPNEAEFGSYLLKTGKLAAAALERGLRRMARARRDVRRRAISHHDGTAAERLVSRHGRRVQNGSDRAGV